MAAAGIAFVDGEGRRVDFYALRHTLATNLARAGVPARLAMELMRHSDLRLTQQTSTDASQLPLAEAVARLPGYGYGGTQADTHWTFHRVKSRIACKID